MAASAPRFEPPSEADVLTIRRPGLAFGGLVLALLALPTSARSTGPEPEALQTSASRTRVTATLVGESARVELEGRRLVDVALGRGASLSSLVASGDRWLLAGSRVAVDGRRRLAIVAGDDMGWRELTPPGAMRARSRDGAVLLGDPDGLELRSELTVAWLEGDGSQRQAVLASRFDDGAFLEPELVAPIGPGSQVALRGVVLTDGTPLLVWSAFDGQDNEIVWSWRRGGAWSQPERIGGDNSVPDVAPTLLATDSGAIAAWSRYDGRGYRIVGSRLSGSEWTLPTTLSGRGAMTARLLADRDGPIVLFQEASPRRWTVARLAADGDERLRATSTASAISDRGDAPWVSMPSTESVELEWPSVASEPPVARRASPVVVVPWQQREPRDAPRAGGRPAR